MRKQKTKKLNTLRRFTHLLMFLGVLGTLTISVPRSAEAHCCGCLQSLQRSVARNWPNTIRIVNNHTTSEFTAHRAWIIAVFWEDNILPAMMLMANQLSAVAMQQTQIIGSFMDAKHQMETQRVLQTIRAQAHKDYHPSAGMCEFGSSIKSLAASERKAELNAHVLSQRSQDRQMKNANASSATGKEGDLKSRLQQYREKFCDPDDNNGGLDLLCDHDGDISAGGAVGATDDERINKDIDYGRTVDYPWTLNADFTDNQITDNEEEIFALANNLYGHTVFENIEAAILKPGTGVGFPAAYSNFMDMRALLAKRSVAENSFNAITSMKTSGTSGSRDFLEAILEELGISTTASGSNPSEMMRLLGFDDSGNEIAPSYHAQMEVLTKKIYQNPDFYTNLYDKPTNVERKEVAMQAIGLMQKFDLFKSYLRNEANISVLLELAVIDLQSEVENKLADQPGGSNQ